MLIFDFYSPHLCNLCRKVWKEVDGDDWNSASGRKYISSMPQKKRDRLYPDLKEKMARGSLEDWDITMLSQLIRDLNGRSAGKAIDFQTLEAVEALNKLRNKLMHKSQTEIPDKDTFMYLWGTIVKFLAKILRCLGESEDILHLACNDILLARSHEVDRLNLLREKKLQLWMNAAVAWLHQVNCELSSKIAKEVELVDSTLGTGRAEQPIPERSHQKHELNANCWLCGRGLVAPIKAENLVGWNPRTHTVSDDIALNQIAIEMSKSVQAVDESKCDDNLEKSSFILPAKIQVSRDFSTLPEISGQIPISEDLPSCPEIDKSDFFLLDSDESDASTHVGVFSDDSESDCDSDSEIGAIHSLYPVSENCQCMELLETQIMKTLRLKFREIFKKSGKCTRSEKSMANLMSEIIDGGLLRDESEFCRDRPLVEVLSNLVQAGMVIPEHQLRFWRIIAELSESELKFLENLRILSEQGIFEVVQKVPTNSHVAFVRMSRFAAKVLSAVLHNYPDLRAALHSGGVSLIVFASSEFGIVSMGSRILIPPSLLQYSIVLANRNQTLKAALETMAAKAGAIDRSVPFTDRCESDLSLATAAKKPVSDSPLLSGVENLYVLARMQENVLLDVAEQAKVLNVQFSTDLKVESEKLESSDHERLIRGLQLDGASVHASTMELDEDVKDCQDEPLDNIKKCQDGTPVNIFFFQDEPPENIKILDLAWRTMRECSQICQQVCDEIREVKCYLSEERKDSAELKLAPLNFYRPLASDSTKSRKEEESQEEVQQGEKKVAVDQVSSYLDTLIEDLGEYAINAKSLPSHTLDSDKILRISKQLDTLDCLKIALKTRGVATQSVSDLFFDCNVDDDEVLLLFFMDVDQDKKGTISLDNLYASDALKENPEMLAALKTALDFGFDAFKDALDHLTLEDFGCTFNCGTKLDSIRCVFESIAFESGLYTKEWMEKEYVLQPNNFLDFFQSHPEIKCQEALTTALKQCMVLCATEISFMSFKDALRKIPRVAGQRIAWVRALGLDGLLARHLQPGSLFDGYLGLKKMKSVELQEALEAFFQDLKNAIGDALEKLKVSKLSISPHQANSKFAMEQNTYVGMFAGMDDFFCGAEESLRLGYPNPNIMKGILLEHTAHPCAWRFFVTSNYFIATCLFVEYWWAIDPFCPPQAVKQFLKRMGEAHENERNDLFPGEEGDRFHEFLVIASIRTTSDALSSLSLKLNEAGLQAELIKHNLLETDEDRARGIKILDQKACLEREEKMKAVLGVVDKTKLGISLTEQISVVDFSYGSEIGDDTVVIGIILPMTETRAKLILNPLKAVLGYVAGLPDDVCVEFCNKDNFFSKTYEFCKITSIADLRKHIDEISDADLLSEARYSWDVNVVDQASRQEICAKIVESFIREELQKDFEHALKKSPEAQLEIIELLWKISRSEYSSKEDRIMSIVASLNTEERYKQIESWISLFHVRLQARFKIGLCKLMEQERYNIERFKLQEGEVLAIHMYTGPSFMVMNSICRRFPQSIVDLLQGDQNMSANTLPTTLFCVSSGLMKLGRHTDIPDDGFVYRGLGKMLLPQQFWVPHGNPPWKGGVERAFMSTTTNKDIALFYSEGKGTVAEISVGRIQIGGDMGWVSMYPGEKEITFPPFTCLETNGEPRVESTQFGEVIIFPLKANVNPKASTVEELWGRRKAMHMGTCKLLRQDLLFAAEENVSNFQAVMGRRKSGLVEVVHGDREQVKIDAETFIIHFNSENCWTTVGAPFLMMVSGKAYFEVEVCDTSGNLYVGIVGTNFGCNFTGNYIGDDDISWSIYADDGDARHRGKWTSFGIDSWLEVGTIFGIAIDLDLGCMQACVLTHDSPLDGGWTTTFDSGISPGQAVGSGLFPAVSGTKGVKIKCNFGHDLVNRPMRLLPPSSEYKCFAEVALQSKTLGYDDVKTLEGLGIMPGCLLRELDLVRSKHEAMDIDLFNHDEIYKDRVNEIIDIKVGVTRKQQDIMALL